MKTGTMMRTMGALLALGPVMLLPVDGRAAPPVPPVNVPTGPAGTRPVATAISTAGLNVAPGSLIPLWQPNLTTWTTTTMPQGNGLSGSARNPIAFVNNTFIAAGTTTGMGANQVSQEASTDGINWTRTIQNFSSTSGMSSNAGWLQTVYGYQNGVYVEGFADGAVSVPRRGELDARHAGEPDAPQRRRMRRRQVRVRLHGLLRDVQQRRAHRLEHERHPDGERDDYGEHAHGQLHDHRDGLWQWSVRGRHVTGSGAGCGPGTGSIRILARRRDLEDRRRQHRADGRHLRVGQLHRRGPRWRLFHLADGAKWSSGIMTGATNTDFDGVACAPTVCAASGSYGGIWTTPVNTMSWTSRVSTGQLFGIAFGANHFVAYGYAAATASLVALTSGEHGAVT